ncbi:MAG TPA: hypothetical protein PKD54_09195, partial [Pirellulaceae bacterium]|nr:hypothetical protein [Pirellulaceae bacterium]
MPTTVNGIGTHYYGKRHLRKELGVCGNCHEQHQLENYETTLFIVILYIPIIPLGRKQIVGCCPSCTYHRAVSMQEWQKLKSTELERTLTALADSIDDPMKALEHLVTLSAFNEMDEAREL